MSLRCRYAPAYGSEVVSFRPVYPALIPQCGFSSKSIAPRERDGARTVSRLRRFVHVSAPALEPGAESQDGSRLRRFVHVSAPAFEPGDTQSSTRSFAPF